MCVGAAGGGGLEGLRVRVRIRFVFLQFGFQFYRVYLCSFYQHVVRES